ncbi:MAG: hypothetical protein ACPG7F_04785 [Aggregatilineales bacterium]
MNTALAIILENEKGLHLLYRHSLEKAGFQTTIVRTEDQFLQLVHTHTPDLVLFDLATITSARQDAFQQLHRLVQYPRTQVVVTSTTPGHGQNLPSHYEFFLKPVRPAAIKKLAAQVMMRSVMLDMVNEPELV